MNLVLLISQFTAACKSSTQYMKYMYFTMETSVSFTPYYSLLSKVLWNIISQSDTLLAPFTNMI